MVWLLAACGGPAGPAAEPAGSSSGDTAADTDHAADTAADSGDTAVVPRTAPIVVHAVRHAEKADEGDDPGLTEAGLARAEALAVVMADVPLAAIYATDLLRTQQTVAPTAADHGLDVVVDLDPEEELAAWLLAQHDGETVLHAGHSYTLSDFMMALGVADPPEIHGYGQLWTLTVDVDGAVEVEESFFGEPEATDAASPAAPPPAPGTPRSPRGSAARAAAAP